MAAALLLRTMRIHLPRLLIPCLAMLVVVSGEFTHDRKRMGPLDVVRAEHGCLEEFEVSESTIIRTEDSRVLGAQFLNETDVGNREDCLALCCATRFCNVAVFEEKRSGSCYLFDCGRPEDLKCQFTGHSYYTSAVLRVNRQKLELGLWSEQSQHEAELTNLSKGLGDVGETLAGSRTRNLPPTTPSQQSPPPPPPPTPSRVTSPTTTTTSTTSTTTTTTTTKPTVPPRKCSRFQFECHSGECIAIYNVCDSIPQCRDNSDEYPKMECPSGSTEGASVSRRLGEGMDGGGPALGGGGGGPWDNSGPARDVNPGMYDGRIFRNRPTILENYGGYQQNGGSGGSGGSSSSSTRGLEDAGAGYGGRGRGVSSYYDTKTRPALAGGPYNTGEGGARGGGGGGGGGGDYMGNPEMRPPFRYPDYGPPRYPPQPQPRLPQQPQQPLQQQYLQPSPHQQQPLQQQHQPPPPPPPPPQPQQQQQQQLLPPQMNSNPVWMDRPGGYNPHGGLGGMPQDLHQQMQDLHHRHPQLPQQGQEYPQQLAGGPPQQEMPQLGGGLRNTEMAMGGGGNGRGPQGGNGLPRGSAAASSSLTSSSVPPSTLPQGGGQNTNTNNTTTNTTNNNGGGGAGEGKGAGGAGAAEGGKNSAVSSEQHLVKAAHASLARLEVNLEELQVGAREQDTQASGAVLALAMGVCITALLVVLVGCRLREVKRRLRRHRGPRSPYAHDADYLVNGMYL